MIFFQYDHGNNSIGLMLRRLSILLYLFRTVEQVELYYFRSSGHRLTGSFKNYLTRRCILRLLSIKKSGS